MTINHRLLIPYLLSLIFYLLSSRLLLHLQQLQDPALCHVHRRGAGGGDAEGEVGGEVERQEARHGPELGPVHGQERRHRQGEAEDAEEELLQPQHGPGPPLRRAEHPQQRRLPRALQNDDARQHPAQQDRHGKGDGIKHIQQPVGAIGPVRLRGVHGKARLPDLIGCVQLLHGIAAEGRRLVIVVQRELRQVQTRRLKETGKDIDETTDRTYEYYKEQ